MSINEQHRHLQFRGHHVPLADLAAAPPNAAQSQEAGFVLDTKSWASLLKPVQDFNAEAPKTVCDLVHQCLAFNPMNRPERMSLEVQGALDHLIDELATEPEDQLEDLNW